MCSHLLQRVVGFRSQNLHLGFTSRFDGDVEVFRVRDKAGGEVELIRDELIDRWENVESPKDGSNTVTHKQINDKTGLREPVVSRYEQ